MYSSGEELAWSPVEISDFYTELVQYSCNESLFYTAFEFFLHWTKQQQHNMDPMLVLR